MEPTIIVEGEAWAWEISKIRRFLKQEGRLGWYRYWFEGDRQTAAEIHLFKIKPLVWKKLLNHEMNHHAITQRSRSFDEAKMANVAYDKETKHGLCEVSTIFGNRA